MSTKGESTPGSPVSPAVEALRQAEDALVDPIALTGGSHLLNAPPWDAEKEKVPLPPKAWCGWGIANRMQRYYSTHTNIF